MKKWGQSPFLLGLFPASKMVTVPIFLLFLTGCTQLKFLPYKDQALTLQDLSREKDGQNKYVHAVNTQFEKLWHAVQSGRIAQYKTRREIVNTFGPPVVVKMVRMHGQDFERALYRHAIQAEATQRVYLYYNTEGILTGHESL